MKKIVITLGLLLTIGQAWGDRPQHLTAGDIITVPISDLHPTQAAIGYRQLDYKLHRYQSEPKKLFDDYCESAGQKGVKQFTPQSSLTDLQSFSCKKSPNSDPQAIKTVVIAPNNGLYLTDGHHTFSNFAEATGMSTQVKVRITDDFSQLPDMPAFWEKMKAANLVWLDTPEGEIQPSGLPSQLGRQHMKNDEYRSLVYFARDVGFSKPDNSPPFLEFYWAKWLANQQPLSGFDLSHREGYAKAVETVATRMTDVPVDTPIAETDRGTLDAQRMGALPEFNRKEMHKLVSAKGKLTWAFAEPASSASSQ